MQLRGEQEKAKQQERFRLACQIARQAAELLQQDFGASKVMLFGSLAHRRWFSATSDIDLAVWGVAKSDYFLAVARLQELSSDFKIDLVDMANCPAALCEVILKEGQPL